MPLRTGDRTHESLIADKMVEILSVSTELAIAEVHVESPVDTQREGKELTRGHIWIDVIDVGVIQTYKNRRDDEYEYETHLVVRARPETTASSKISRAWVDQMKWYRDYAQAQFSVAQGNHRLLLSDGRTAHRSVSQPFVLVGRENLYGQGVFIAPVQINWKLLKR